MQASMHYPKMCDDAILKALCTACPFEPIDMPPQVVLVEEENQCINQLMSTFRIGDVVYSVSPPDAIPCRM